MILMLNITLCFLWGKLALVVFIIQSRAFLLVHQSFLFFYCTLVLLICMHYCVSIFNYIFSLLLWCKILNIRIGSACHSLEMHYQQPNHFKTLTVCNCVGAFHSSTQTHIIASRWAFHNLFYVCYYYITCCIIILALLVFLSCFHWFVFHAAISSQSRELDFSKKCRMITY